jgi:uncharacterized damage-inducible protein DinB
MGTSKGRDIQGGNRAGLQSLSGSSCFRQGTLYSLWKNAPACHPEGWVCPRDLLFPANERQRPPGVLVRKGENKMIKILEPMMNEIQQEAAITKRVLERVPADKLTWKPHTKSMSLGQLALHVATIPGNLSKLAQQDGLDTSQANFDPPPPADAKEILSSFEASIKATEENLGKLSESAALGQWRLTSKGKEVFSIPRVALLRSIMLNHWYHHRGQLSVYLRLLEVPVPVIYGRSADENPFA